MKYSDVSDMKGVTLCEVAVNVDEDRIVFKADDGREWLMYHSQDCCEGVYLDDVCGDLQDLVGSPLIVSEECDNGKEPDDFDPSYHESYTWTFYRFATAKGHVTLRWFGSSNGYYSEGVDFYLTKEASDV